MNSNLNPSLYQINTRVWLDRLFCQIGRPAMVDAFLMPTKPSLSQSVRECGQRGTS